MANIIASKDRISVQAAKEVVDTDDAMIWYNPA